MAGKDFNKSHPEIQEGEVWLMNIAPTRRWETRAASDGGGLREVQTSSSNGRTDWECIGHQTKRLGTTAYTVHGEPISEMRPIFVQRLELEEAGIDPDNLSEGRVRKEG